MDDFGVRHDSCVLQVLHAVGDRDAPCDCMLDEVVGFDEPF